MAHDVNQSEKDIAAQVRSALVSRISAERYELWIAPETRWHWSSGTLTISFATEFACQLARRMFGKDLMASLRAIAGTQAVLQMVVATVSEEVMANSELVVSTAEDAATCALAMSDVAMSDAATACNDNAEAETCPILPLPTILPLSQPPVLTQPQTAQPTLPSTNIREGWGNFLSGDCNQLSWTTANMVMCQP